MVVHMSNHKQDKLMDTHNKHHVDDRSYDHRWDPCELLVLIDSLNLRKKTIIVEKYRRGFMFYLVLQYIHHHLNPYRFCVQDDLFFHLIKKQKINIKRLNEFYKWLTRHDYCLFVCLVNVENIVQICNIFAAAEASFI
jgi:hypothetical protein